MFWHPTTAPFTASGSGAGYSSATRTINGVSFTVHQFLSTGTLTFS
jgi:hypothetical protein